MKKMYLYNFTFFLNGETELRQYQFQSDVNDEKEIELAFIMYRKFAPKGNKLQVFSIIEANANEVFKMNNKL